jgi:hypothetical protein
MAAHPMTRRDDGFGAPNAEAIGDTTREHLSQVIPDPGRNAVTNR